VPPGNYLLQASVTAFGDANADAQVYCQLNPRPIIGTTLGEGDSQLLPSGGSEYSSIAFNAVTTFTEATPVTLNCQFAGSGGLSFINPTVVAIPFDVVNPAP
jgi:hypothetical protein